jgi:acyl dehydratase
MRRFLRGLRSCSRHVKTVMQNIVLSPGAQSWKKQEYGTHSSARRLLPQITRYRQSKSTRLYNNFQYCDSAAQRPITIKSSTIPYLGRGVKVGQYASAERLYTSEDVERFSSLVQDFNPLHSAMDWDESMKENESWKLHESNGLIQFVQHENSKTSLTTKPIVHGMLVACIFSSIFARLSPGCVYMNQSLNFSAPVYVNEHVVGRIEIEKIRKWRKGGVVVQCITLVTSFRSGNASLLESDNKTDEQPQKDLVESPRTSEVVVKGIANVWLPSGFAA